MPSHLIRFANVCAFEFYRIFERIGHLLDRLIFAAFIAAFNVGPFGFGLTLWQDPFFGLWPTNLRGIPME